MSHAIDRQAATKGTTINDPGGGGNREKKWKALLQEKF